MASTLTLARLAELLATIDASASVLRTFVQHEQTKHGCDATYLDLPFHSDAGVASQAAVLRIACERLAQLVTPPRHLVFEAAGSFYTTLALQIAVRSGIATLIDRMSNEADEEGVPVSVLSNQSRLDVDLLARILRHLSVVGIFQEIAPDVFANTTGSSTLIDNPEFDAHLDVVMHEGMLAAPFFPDLVTKRFAAANDGVAPSAEAGDRALQPVSAFTLYTGGQSLYEWMHSPAHADRGRNFNLAMRGGGRTEGIAFLPFDYPFSALPVDTLVVDIGGGIGTLPALIIPSVPHLRFVVQDLESVVGQARESVGADMKRWVAAGRVRFEVHDCFTAQGADKAGAVFIIKKVLHNFSDAKALQLLAAIRPSHPAKLLIIDHVIVRHLRTQAASPGAESAIYRKLRGGAATKAARGAQNGAGAELAASSQRIPTVYDLMMASTQGGRTRTVEGWGALLAGAGFHLDKVYPLRASTGLAVLEATVL